MTAWHTFYTLLSPIQHRVPRGFILSFCLASNTAPPPSTRFEDVFRVFTYARNIIPIQSSSNVHYIILLESVVRTRFNKEPRDRFAMFALRTNPTALLRTPQMFAPPIILYAICTRTFTQHRRSLRENADPPNSRRIADARIPRFYRNRRDVFITI